jgi:hypothetical protein
MRGVIMIFLNSCVPTHVHNSISLYPIFFVQSFPLFTYINQKGGIPSSYKNSYFGELSKFIYLLIVMGQSKWPVAKIIINKIKKKNLGRQPI